MKIEESIYLKKRILGILSITIGEITKKLKIGAFFWKVAKSQPISKMHLTKPKTGRNDGKW